MRAAARGVLLLLRGHVAGTHRAAVHPPAFADADAAQNRAIDASFVFRKLEMRRRQPGMKISAQAEVLGGVVGSDDLAGIHLPIGIPDGLELAECLHELLAEHLRKQLRARLAVAVLAGK